MSGKSSGRYRSVLEASVVMVAHEGRLESEEEGFGVKWMDGRTGRSPRNCSRPPWAKGRFDERLVHCLLLDVIRTEETEGGQQT